MTCANMTSLQLFRALIFTMGDPPVTNDIVNQFLTTASCRLCADAYGTKYAEASVWLAAHLIAMSGLLEGGSTVTATSGGPVASRKTGDESISWGAPLVSSSALSLTDADLMLTHYGRQFVFLRDTRPASLPTTISIC